MSTTLTAEQEAKIKAKCFDHLLAHLQSQTGAQNKDIMDVAGFCRNCLSKWYKQHAEEEGVKDVDLDDVKKMVYGMPYNEWKEKYQK